MQLALGEDLPTHGPQVISSTVNQGKHSPPARHQALPTPAWGMDIAAGRQTRRAPVRGTDARDTLPGPTPRPTAPRAHKHHRDAPTLRVKEHRGSGLCRAWPRARPHRPRRSVRTSSGHRTGPRSPPPSSGKVRIRKPERERTVSYMSSRRRSGPPCRALPRFRERFPHQPCERRKRPRPRGSPGPRHGPPPHPTKHLRPAVPVRVHSQLPRPGAGPGVAGPGLHAGRRAPKADAALPAAPSPAGLAGRAADGGRSEAPFRPPRPRPLPGRGLGASHSARPGPHSFFSQPRPPRQGAGPTERPRSGPAATTRPAELCGRPPKLGWGRIPPTYIFPPPPPPPAVLSR